jgi:cysteine-rich repeat protein
VYKHETRTRLARIMVCVTVATVAIVGCANLVGSDPSEFGEPMGGVGATAGHSPGGSGQTGVGGAGGGARVPAGEPDGDAVVPEPGVGRAGGAAGQAGQAGEGGGEGSSTRPCGDGSAERGGACDDQNGEAGDGCSDCAVEPGWACDGATPSVCAPAIVSIDGGATHTCAALGTGETLCWGGGEKPLQLGYDYDQWQNIGDDETPASLGPLRIEGTVREVAAGGRHSCALLASRALRCWGFNGEGQLGYAGRDYFGDATQVEDIHVGAPVKHVVASDLHTCALLTTQNVRCWGHGPCLGYGTLDEIGDTETPESAGDVNIGGPVQQLAAGGAHTCALLTTGTVRCWGDNYYGQLGYPNVGSHSGDRTPADLGDVDVGGAVRQVVAGANHTCALLESGKVRCWGEGGILGYGNDNAIGDDEPPAAAGDVDLGVLAEGIVAGDYHTCALTAAGTVHCWGGRDGGFGATGYGTTHPIGDDELPSSMGAVNVGEPVSLLAAGGSHTCAVLPGSKLRCWGLNSHGQLGYAHQENIGDDEPPAVAGFVEYH